MPLPAFSRRLSSRSGSSGLGGSALLARAGRAALVLALLLSSLVAVAATVLAFTVALDGSNVRVDWEVNTEADVTGFDLYRKGAADLNYVLLTSIVPTGQRRYTYTDRSAYRGPAAPTGSSTYRLTVRGGAEQSYTTTLAQTPSAVQRSWGTIKSMFR